MLFSWSLLNPELIMKASNSREILMKRFVIVALFFAGAAAAFAGTDREAQRHRPDADPFAAEARMFLNKHRDTAIGDLTFGDVETFMARLSVPLQESAYVRRIGAASMMIPGAGEFMAGDAAGGTLFVAADILVAAGTVAGVYFLLPAELQFDKLDYVNSTHTQIKDAWKTAAESATLATMWPTVAVVTGSVILRKVFSVLSARHAADLAKENIETGKVAFRPNPALLLSPGGKPGFGMRLAY